MSPVLPGAAEVVVIGGGVIGLATAYELARSGTQVVLLDSGPFGAGSTCKAAGGVRANFSDEINIQLGKRSLDIFERFDELFDQEIDLHQVGYLFLLDNELDVAHFEAAVALQNSLGVQSQVIEPDDARRLSPYISTDGLLAGVFSPRDGHCTPESVVLGYSRAARRAGATLIPSCAVTGADVTDGHIRAVHTAAGTIAADQVVCAAGAWSRQIGEWFGVDLPVDPLRRQVVVTEPVPHLPADTPFTIDFATSFYFHNEGPGLLIGMSDPHETPGFKTSRGEEWLPGLADAIERRAPALADFGISSGWAGLYEMTPDHNGLVGEAPEVPGFFYCTGFSGHGFLLGPALGEVMSDLCHRTTPTIDITALDSARFADVLRPERNCV